MPVSLDQVDQALVRCLISIKMLENNMILALKTILYPLATSTIINL